MQGWFNFPEKYVDTFYGRRNSAWPSPHPPASSPLPLALGPKALRAEAFGGGRGEEEKLGFCGGRLRRPPQNPSSIPLSPDRRPRGEGSPGALARFGRPPDRCCPFRLPGARRRRPRQRLGSAGGTPGLPALSDSGTGFVPYSDGTGYGLALGTTAGAGLVAGVESRAVTGMNG
jgi:hypothetical protein